MRSASEAIGISEQHPMKMSGLLASQDRIFTAATPRGASRSCASLLVSSRKDARRLTRNPRRAAAVEESRRLRNVSSKTPQPHGEGRRGDGGVAEGPAMCCQLA